MYCNIGLHTTVLLLNVLYFVLGVLSISALDPALVGLSLVYTVSLVGLFQYVVILSTEVEGLVCALVLHACICCIILKCVRLYICTSLRHGVCISCSTVVSYTKNCRFTQVE